MSYLDRLVGKLPVRVKRAHASDIAARRRAALAGAVESLEGRRLLSAVSISPATTTEGQALVYNVNLDAASTSPVTVKYNLAGGTAKANKNYTGARAGAVTFAPGETSKQITVATRADGVYGGNKTLNVRLGNPGKGNTISGSPIATGTIVDIDAAPVITVTANPRVTEGNRGNTPMTFTITTSSLAEKPIKVTYSTVDVTATSTGRTADYTRARGTATFSGKTTTKTVKVNVKGDTVDEANEAFRLQLLSAANAQLPDRPYGVGTIVDDDGGTDVATGTTVSATPTVTANPGTTAGVLVTLNDVAADPVTVNYTTADGTATAGSDYTATTGTLTFDVGETSKLIPVSVLGGADAGTFNVNLTGATGAAVAAASSAVNIVTVPPAPALSVSDVTVQETAGTATFTVTLGAAATQAVSVNYATSDGTATAGSDYTAVTAGALTFAAGETSKTITVPILNDAAVEDNETFNVTLTQPLNATLADAVGTATIISDDGNTNPNPDNGGVAFNQGTSNTVWEANVAQGYRNTLQFKYSITNSRTTPVDGAQIQIFLVPQGTNLDTATAYATHNVGTIGAGQTVTGTADARGGPTPNTPGQWQYYARLVANNVVLATDTGPGIFIS